MASSADWLYVMQNEHGLVKIGRSNDPCRRRADISSGSGCLVHLVFSAIGRGIEEMEIHQKLKHLRVRDDISLVIGRNIRWKADPTIDDGIQLDVARVDSVSDYADQIAALDGQFDAGLIGWDEYRRGLGRLSLAPNELVCPIIYA